MASIQVLPTGLGTEIADQPRLREFSEPVDRATFAEGIRQRGRAEITARDHHHLVASYVPRPPGRLVTSIQGSSAQAAAAPAFHHPGRRGNRAPRPISERSSPIGSSGRGVPVGRRCGVDESFVGASDPGRNWRQPYTAERRGGSSWLVRGDPRLGHRRRHSDRTGRGRRLPANESRRRRPHPPYRLAARCRMLEPGGPAATAGRPPAAPAARPSAPTYHRYFSSGLMLTSRPTAPSSFAKASSRHLEDLRRGLGGRPACTPSVSPQGAMKSGSGRARKSPRCAAAEVGKRKGCRAAHQRCSVDPGRSRWSAAFLAMQIYLPATLQGRSESSIEVLDRRHRSPGLPRHLEHETNPSGRRFGVEHGGAFRSRGMKSTRGSGRAAPSISTISSSLGQHCRRHHGNGSTSMLIDLLRRHRQRPDFEAAAAPPSRPPGSRDVEGASRPAIAEARRDQGRPGGAGGRRRAAAAHHHRARACSRGEFDSPPGLRQLEHPVPAVDFDEPPAIAADDDEGAFRRQFAAPSPSQPTRAASPSAAVPRRALRYPRRVVGSSRTRGARSLGWTPVALERCTPTYHRPRPGPAAAVAIDATDSIIPAPRAGARSGGRADEGHPGCRFTGASASRWRRSPASGIGLQICSSS